MSPSDQPFHRSDSHGLHWLATGLAGDTTYAVMDETRVEGWTRAGWTVTGPFVPVSALSDVNDLLATGDVEAASEWIARMVREGC